MSKQRFVTVVRRRGKRIRRGKPQRIDGARRLLRMETLQSRCLLAAQPVISELVADNAGELLDGDGQPSDWIEIYNAGDSPVNLGGYFLTDDANDLTRWQFPAQILEPAQFLVAICQWQSDTGCRRQSAHEFSTGSGWRIPGVGPAGRHDNRQSVWT